MRLGFFAGIGGDFTAFEAVRELLADCDRLVSLGNLLGQPGPTDGRVLAAAGALVAEGRLLLLAGPGERARSRDAALPPQLREMLRDASPATVLEGVAILAGGAPPAPRTAPIGQRIGPSVEGPQLVAPVTVAAAEATRTWRAAAGCLARIEPLTGVLSLPRGGERLRIDVGPATGDDGVLGTLAIDLAARSAEVRERLWFVARLPAAARVDPASGGRLRRAGGVAGSLR